MTKAAAIPGHAEIVIPFPEAGPWVSAGHSLNLGPFRQGLCSGNLYKTIDNKLYVFVEVMTWGTSFIKADMPLHVPAVDEDASILHIRWEDKGVRLQQDARQPIHVDWQQHD